MLVPFSQMWCLSKPDIDGFFCLAKFYKFSIKKVKDRLSFTFGSIISVVGKTTVEIMESILL